MKHYELRSQETSEALEFRNSLFSPVDETRWRAMRCTGVVARAEPGDHEIGADPNALAGRIVGFIPLQFRNQVIRPGLSIPVVYENAVGVDERLRSRGIGGRMIETAASFIANRVDALFVIRGGEGSTGYRFYRKTGHSDLCYHSSFVHSEPSRLRAGIGAAGKGFASVSVLQETAWMARERELLRLYHREYGAFGGDRRRDVGFWREIVDGHVFGGRPWRFLLAEDRRGRTMGYAVVVYGTWKDMDDPCVYELVACDEPTRLALLAESAAGRGDGQTLRFPAVSLDNPIRTLLRRAGFTDGRSEPQIMARIVAPERLFGRLVDHTEGLPVWWHAVRVTCSTPERTFQLQDRSDPDEILELEMKEHTLASMLCCRIDVPAAVAEQRIRVRAPADHLVDVLGEVCRPAPWVQWYTDYT